MNHNSKNTLYSVIIGFFILFLMGCSSAPRAKPVNQQPMQQQLLALQQWQIDGKLAIQQDKQGASLSFDWQHQSANDYLINLSGSLGQGASRLTVNPGDVALVLDNGKEYVGDNPQTLVKSVLGWDIPFHSLDYWIRGLPSPDATHSAKYDDYYRLVSLTQHGWQIEYTDFYLLNGFELPAKFRASNNDVVLKVVIKEWTLEK